MAMAAAAARRRNGMREVVAQRGAVGGGPKYGGPSPSAQDDGGRSLGSVRLKRNWYSRGDGRGGGSANERCCGGGDDGAGAADGDELCELSGPLHSSGGA